MKLVEAIALRVKNILEDRGINQYYLHKNGGIPRSTLSELVSSKKKRVSLDTIYQICSTLNMTLAEFFNDKIFSPENLDD